MAMASMIMQFGGMAEGGVSAFYGARSEKSSLGFQASLSDLNARLAESTAQTTLQAGQLEEQRSRVQTAQLKSTQKVGMAASGVGITDEGSARVLTSTDVLGEIDANTINANAVRAAWGYRTQAVEYQNDALLKRAAAKSISPFSAAASSILGSASSVAKSWYANDKASSSSQPARKATASQSTNLAAMGGFGNFGMA